jgi:hypothetical protein
MVAASALGGGASKMAGELGHGAASSRGVDSS